MRRYSFNGEPILTNGYRNNKYGQHLGEDYATPHRTALYAKAKGKVVSAKGTEIRQWLVNTPSDPYKKILFGKIVPRALRTEDYGNYIKVYHGKDIGGNTIHTLCAHLDEILVYEGQYVDEGELIGYSDSKGNSTGNHIHEEIRRNDWVIDPNKFDYDQKLATEGGVNAVVTESKGKVMVSVHALNVRKGPATTYDRSGSITIYRGNIIDVVGYTRGEEVSGNNIWYKSWKGNYFWAGGTDKPHPTEVAKKKHNMTPEQIEAKKQEFDARKAQLDAKQKELDEKNLELEKEFEALDADTEVYLSEYDAFIAGLVEEPTADEVVEAEVETGVEEPQEAAEVEVDEVEEEHQEQLNKLEEMIKDLREKLGK